jgi:hypothetical protein
MDILTSGLGSRLALAAVLAALAGCYSPLLRDCTVSCAAPTDCAGDQVCGEDGLCAAPEVAGHCAAIPPDAGTTLDDAFPDAAPPDGPATVKLRVQVSGKGSVVIDGLGICSSLDPQRGDCMYDVPAAVAQRARAVSLQPTEVFASWTSPTCSGQGPICVFTAAAATTIAAKFQHH